MKRPLLSEMTLREKIGQCIQIKPKYIYMKPEGDYNETARPLSEAEEIIKKEQFGAIWNECTEIYIMACSQNKDKCKLEENIFEPTYVSDDWKVKSEPYRNWVKNQSKLFNIPPLSTGDFTPGAGRSFSDLSIVSSLLTIGAANSEELAEEIGGCLAREMRSAGINWRWSPVMDISSRFSYSIGRSFVQNDTEKMISLANAYIKGTQAEGVAACAKHFPGSDRVEYRDAHVCPAVLNSSLDEWWAEQGKIFQGVIDGGVYSIMVAHNSFPAVDDTKVGDLYLPSTLSKKVVTDLLKGKMGFKGVVITDDIGMGGVRATYDYETLVVECLNAGNDVLLGCEPETGDIIEKAVLDGRISEERIDDAVTRILDMKEKIGLFNDDYYDIPYTSEELTAKTREVDRKIAEKSITLIRDENKLFPLDKGKIKNVTVIASSHFDSYITDLEVLKKEFEKRGASVKLQRRLGSREELKQISEESDLILYSAYVDFGVPMGAPFLFGDECRTYFFGFAYGKEKSIGVSMGYPYIHYDIMENARTFVNTYTKNKLSIEAFVSAMYGEIPFDGVSPVDLENCGR